MSSPRKFITEHAEGNQDGCPSPGWVFMWMDGAIIILTTNWMAGIIRMSDCK